MADNPQKSNTEDPQPSRDREDLEPHVYPPHNRESDGLLGKMSLTAMLVYSSLLVVAITYAPSTLLEFAEFECLWCPPVVEGAPQGMNLGIDLNLDPEVGAGPAADLNPQLSMTDGPEESHLAAKDRKPPSGNHQTVEKRNTTADPSQADRPPRSHLTNLLEDEPVPYTGNFLSAGLRARALLSAPVLIQEGEDRCRAAGVIPVFEQAMPDFDDCYHVARADGELFGQLRPKLVLRRDGKVRSTEFQPLEKAAETGGDQIAPLPEIEHQSLRRCVRNRLMRMSFPCVKQWGKPISIMFPLKFLQQN